MASSTSSRILILACDAHRCGELMKSLAQCDLKWHLVVETLISEELQIDRYADIVILDIGGQGTSRLEWVSRIISRWPQTVVIIASSQATKQLVIKAMRSGASDFLEEPIKVETLQSSIHRALAVQERLRTIDKLLDLDQAQALHAQKEQLEQLNLRLVESNRAFATLTRNLDMEREEMQKQIGQKIGALILPAIEKFQRADGMEKHAMELTALRRMIETLTSEFAPNALIASKLSATEMRVASLIKSGLTSEEIARELHVAPDTVRTHRKNIRKKLKVKDSNHNLRDYLRSKLP